MSTQKLLEAITRNVPLSARVAEAFRQVDRALFVPAYYRHQGAEWILEASDALVYEDRALTTQVRNGLASSSSSQPSVMALMLEALDVQPGQRVLEIGTGTGYNAALLAHLVGEHGQVVSVELDEDLLLLAKRRLHAAGCAERVTLVHADGRQMVGGDAAFDRIMVTAGFRRLALAWIQQLRPAGVLVGNVRGKICSVLLTLQKDEQLQMAGHLLPQGAFFMEIHGADYPGISEPDWRHYDTLAMRKRTLEPDLLQALEHQAFLFFLEGQLPGVYAHLRAFGTPEHHEICQVFRSEESTAILHRNGTVEARGSLWDSIERAYECYQQSGAPALTDYRITVTDQTISASIQATCWTIQG